MQEMLARLSSVTAILTDERPWANSGDMRGMLLKKREACRNILRQTMEGVTLKE